MGNTSLPVSLRIVASIGRRSLARCFAQSELAFFALRRRRWWMANRRRRRHRQQQRDGFVVFASCDCESSLAILAATAAASTSAPLHQMGAVAHVRTYSRMGLAKTALTCEMRDDVLWDLQFPQTYS